MSGQKRIKGNPGRLPAVAKPPVSPPPSPLAADRTATITVEDGVYYAVSGAVRFRLDEASVLHIRGEVTGRPTSLRPGQSFAAPEELRPAIECAKKHAAELSRVPGVVAVRAGYKFMDGRITNIPCVVVAVDRKAPKNADPADLVREGRCVPAVLLPEGIPTDVTPADPVELLRVGDTEAAAGMEKPRLFIEELQSADEELVEAVPVITYEPPPDGNLQPVTAAMTVTCHVSPDAGWPTLRSFLQATERKLHMGMYDFTAPHIYRVVRSLLRDSEIEWQQVLGPNESIPDENDVDSTKANDKPEAEIIKGLRRVAGSRFKNVFARVGSGETFASAYHIKVAVRDDEGVWLSSGNLQSSNQPDIDFLDEDADRQLIPKYNREWHVVIENQTLAQRLQRFLDHDFETATTAPEGAILPPVALPDLLVPADELLEEERAALDLEVFPPRRFVFTKQKPLTVQPILTPDNYIDVVLDFLRRKPAARMYFQNQSLNPVKQPTSAFAEMMRLLAEYSHDPDLDVRIIIRNIGPVRKKLESLKAAGFNTERIRLQAGCHTKGIIVDSRIVLVGSHNFTNQGVEANRDASLLIEHDGIARYFERVFLHDWERLARPGIREESMPIPESEVGRAGLETEAMEPLLEKYVKVPWSHFQDE